MVIINLKLDRIRINNNNNNNNNNNKYKLVWRSVQGAKAGNWVFQASRDYLNKEINVEKSRKNIGYKGILGSLVT
jgi:hypothetical protein